MEIREYFKQIAKEGKRLKHLNALIKEIDCDLAKMPTDGVVSDSGLTAGETYRDVVGLKKRYEEERKGLLEKRRKAEEVLNLVPVVDGAQIIRRRYLFGWSMEKAAREVGYSERGAHYIQGAALKWISDRRLLP